MRGPSRAGGSLPAALAVVGANLLPLAGVLFAGWEIGSLLVVYWVEGLWTVLLAAAKALFAERGSPSPSVSGRVEPLHELREKRGGVSPRPGWPPVYPRNVPFALSILGTWVALVVPTSVFFWLSVAPPVEPSVGLALGVLALPVVGTAEFRRYVRDREYETSSAREILAGPAGLVLLLGLLAMLTAGGGRAGGVVVLAALVLAKTGAAARREFADRDDPLLGPVADRLEGVVERFGEDDLAEEPPEIEPPAGEPDARVAVEPLPVLLGSLPTVAFGFLHRGVLTVLALFGFVTLVAGPIGLLLAAAFAAAVVAARVGSYYLRYGTVEYRRHGDRIVAHDTLLGAPQWTAPIGGATFSVRNAVPDRLLGTGTLEIAGAGPDDRTVQFGPVADLDAAVETLGLPVTDTERPERDLTVIAAGGLLAAVFLVLPVGIALSPSTGAEELVAVAVVGTPFLLPLFGALVWAALRRV